MVRLQRDIGFVHRAQVGRRALLESLAEGVQRLAQTRDQGCVGALLVGQRCRPAIGHRGSGRVEPGRHAIQLGLRGVYQAGVQCMGLLRNARHRCFEHRFDDGTHCVRTIAQAVAQGLAHRAGKLGIDGFDIAVEGLLVA